MIERYSWHTEESSLKIAESHVEVVMRRSLQKESWRQYQNNFACVWGRYTAPEKNVGEVAYGLEKHPDYNMAVTTLKNRHQLLHDRTGVERGELNRNEITCDVSCWAEAHENWMVSAQQFIKEMNQRFPKVQFSHKLAFKHLFTQYQNDLGRNLKSASQQEYYELLWHLPNSSKLFDGAFELQSPDINFSNRVADLSCLVEASFTPISLSADQPVDVVIMTDEYEFQKTFMTDLHLKNAARRGARIGCSFHPDLQIYFSRNLKSGLCFFDETGGLFENGNDRHLLVSEGIQKNHYSDYRTAIEKGNVELETCATWAAYDGFPSAGYFPVQLESRQPLNSETLFKGDVLFIVNMGGSQVSEAGEWTIPIQLGYFMRDGQFLGRVQPMTCVANYHQMLTDDFLGIGNLPFKGGIRTGMRTKMRIQNL